MREKMYTGDKFMDFLFNNAGKLLILSVIFFILCYVSITILAIKRCSEVQENGLRSIVESIWEGPSKKEK